VPNSEARRPQLGLDVHAVWVGADLVALDLRRGAYLCLPGPTSDPPPRPPSGGPGVLDRLAAAGLACAEASASPYAPPPRPGADLGEPVRAGLTASDLRQAVRATWDVFSIYRRRSLAGLIEYIERPQVPPRADLDVLSLARRFSRWVVLPPVPDKCLVRAFMLLRYLQRHGGSAQWVFGVATWPFRAHCWVQHGDVVLDDHHERLIPYTPLFAVRA
jgi:hypothetical protein